jgi:hypothetical protein
MIEDNRSFNTKSQYGVPDLDARCNKPVSLPEVLPSRDWQQV